MNPIDRSSIPYSIDFDVYNIAYDALEILKDDLGENLFDPLACELNARYYGFVFPLTFIPYTPTPFYEYEQTYAFAYYSVLNLLKRGKCIPLVHKHVLPYLETSDDWKLFSSCSLKFHKDHHCIMGIVDRISLTRCRVIVHDYDSWSIDYVQNFYDKGAHVTFHRWMKESTVEWSTDPVTGRGIIDETADGEYYNPQYAFFETDDFSGGN